MNRAIVVKTYGDSEIAGAIVDGMSKAPALNAAELETVRAENVRLKALNGVRSYGDSVRLETACKALAVKYSTKHVGRLYGAILGAWALLWYEVVQWVEYFREWNRS